VPCTLIVSQDHSVEKNAARRALGMNLIEHGSDFQESREFAIQLAKERGAHMVPSFHPDLLRGVATYWWELRKPAPAIAVIYVPIGLGSGAFSALAAKRALGHSARIVGVVRAHATTYADSFQAGKVVEAPAPKQIADAIACRVADPEVAQGMRHIFACTHNVAVGAGAASFAAAMQERGNLQG